MKSKPSPLPPAQSAIPLQVKDECRKLCDKWKDKGVSIVVLVYADADKTQPTLWPTTNNEGIVADLICQAHQVFHEPMTIDDVLGTRTGDGECH